MFCQPIPWQQVGDPLGRMIGQTRRKAPRVFKKDACNKGLSRRSVRRPPPFFPGGNFAKARAQLRAARTMEHAPPRTTFPRTTCARGSDTFRTRCSTPWTRCSRPRRQRNRRWWCSGARPRTFSASGSSAPIAPAAAAAAAAENARRLSCGVTSARSSPSPRMRGEVRLPPTAAP